MLCLLACFLRRLMGKWIGNTCTGAWHTVVLLSRTDPTKQDSLSAARRPGARGRLDWLERSRWTRTTKVTARSHLHLETTAHDLERGMGKHSVCCVCFWLKRTEDGGCIVLHRRKSSYGNATWEREQEDKRERERAQKYI